MHGSEVLRSTFTPLHPHSYFPTNLAERMEAPGTRPTGLDRALPFDLSSRHAAQVWCWGAPSRPWSGYVFQSTPGRLFTLASLDPLAPLVRQSQFQLSLSFVRLNANLTCSNWSNRSKTSSICRAGCRRLKIERTHQRKRYTLVSNTFPPLLPPVLRADSKFATGCRRPNHQESTERKCAHRNGLV